MDWLDRTLYRVKASCPWLYDIAAWGGRQATVALYGRAIRRARRQSPVQGTVTGAPATMRYLGKGDLDALVAMLEAMPEKHLQYFRPHGLDRPSLQRVIQRADIMTYGLFVGDEVCAYAILKLFPTRKAYIGRLVAPSMAGLGIGRFLSRYLYWQARLLGFQPCSTIHEDNLASLKSHAAVRAYQVVADLPNGFRLIRFAFGPEDDTPPELCVEKRAKRPESQPHE